VGLLPHVAGWHTWLTSSTVGAVKMIFWELPRMLFAMALMSITWAEWLSLVSGAPGVTSDFKRGPTHRNERLAGTCIKKGDDLRRE
jgi:hypothetical protein